jgi:acyl carrier protein
MILDGIREILDAMEVDGPVAPDTRVDEGLGLDSIRRIELVIEIENRFRVRLEPEDEAEVETIGDLVRVIRRRLVADD